jgi:predicted ABC-type ATPase
MPKQPPTIYLIAGCNGSGKTTFAKEFLPNEVKCLRFLNADEMAPARIAVSDLDSINKVRGFIGS